jgi:hypothetical protein
MFEQYRPQLRSRLRSARIPAKYQGLTMDSPYIKDIEVSPPHPLEQWIDKATSGLIIGAAGRFETCGVGLWLRGVRGGPALLSAILQHLMVEMEADGITGMYVNVEDYLQWERDRDFEGSLLPQTRDRSVLVLAGLGGERSTEWTDGTVRSLLTRRFEAGLPTLVSAQYAASTILGEGLGTEMFLPLAIMEASR